MATPCASASGVPEQFGEQVDDGFRFGGVGCPLQAAGTGTEGDRVFGVCVVVPAVGQALLLVGGADAVTVADGVPGAGQGHRFRWLT